MISPFDCVAVQEVVFPPPTARDDADEIYRHCEERSDEAIQSFLWRWIASLRSQ
jgi:hypothetical protein